MLKNHVFGSFNLNSSEKHRLSFEDIFLGTLDTYTKKMNPPSAVLGGGVHGKVCWLIAYMVVLMNVNLCKQIEIFKASTVCGLRTKVTVSEWVRYAQTSMSVLRVLQLSYELVEVSLSISLATHYTETYSNLGEQAPLIAPRFVTALIVTSLQMLLNFRISNISRSASGANLMIKCHLRVKGKNLEF